MDIFFVACEPSERNFFAAEMSAHTLHFVEEGGDVTAEAEIVSVFLYTQIDAAFLDGHPRLRLVCTRSTGFDHIDVAECKKRGVTVCNVPSYGENTVAEHTFALILALSRRLRESLTANRQRHFSYEALRGFELKGKTLGIIGSGRIGLHAIRIACGFEMNVIAFDVQTQPLVAEVLGFRYVPLEELLARADIVSLHIPLSPQTRHILNRETLAKCKPGALIINTARGQLIDTAALDDALESGAIAGAGLDVLEDERVLQQENTSIISGQILSAIQTAPRHGAELRAQNPARIHELQNLMRNSRLIARPNVIFTPHSAFNSVEAVERINRTTVENVARFLRGAPRHTVEPPAAAA